MTKLTEEIQVTQALHQRLSTYTIAELNQVIMVTEDHEVREVARRVLSERQAAQYE